MKDKLAFPLNELDQITGQIFAQHFGMTLRDYFAAKVMQSGMVNATGLPDVSDESLQVFCGQCYRVADAMLKAREA